MYARRISNNNSIKIRILVMLWEITENSIKSIKKLHTGHVLLHTKITVDVWIPENFDKFFKNILEVTKKQRKLGKRLNSTEKEFLQICTTLR